MELVLQEIEKKYSFLFEHDYGRLVKDCQNNNSAGLKEFEDTYDVSWLRSRRPELVFIAAKNGSLTVLKILVEEWEIPSDQKHWGKTPLEVAKDNGYDNVVQYLNGRM